jgi:hypothetical protein
MDILGIGKHYNGLRVGVIGGSLRGQQQTPS